MLGKMRLLLVKRCNRSASFTHLTLSTAHACARHPREKLQLAWLAVPHGPAPVREAEDDRIEGRSQMQGIGKEVSLLQPPVVPYTLARTHHCRCLSPDSSRTTGHRSLGCNLGTCVSNVCACFLTSANERVNIFCAEHNSSLHSTSFSPQPPSPSQSTLVD